MTAMAQALSAALLHFTWQGLVIGFLLWIALFILQNRSPRARYLASCLALAAMAVLPAITACLLYTAPAPAHAMTGTAASSGAAASVAIARSATVDWAAWLDRWALPVWSIGVLLFSLRLVWSARRIAMVRRQSQAPEASVMEIVKRLGERMGLAQPVRVLMTAAADCPSVVGWIRPVVLLPAATLAGLTPQQLEAVLAHELAHILRYDYVVNMLQTAIETLLFYHPAVWWASARVRHERELCCDDLAVESCGDALCYARALTRLERLRLTSPSLALGSTGGSLMYRIRRITGELRGGHAPSKLPGILALSLGLACFALNMQWARGQQQYATVPDEPGVRVDLGGATVMHRDPVQYPIPALDKHIEGTVILEATVDATGAVSDARVLSGPAELRKAALQSVLDWHFTPEAAGSTRQVSIAFQVPPEGARLARRKHMMTITRDVRGGVGGGVSAGVGGGVAGGIAGGVGQELNAEQAEEFERQAREQKELAELGTVEFDGQNERADQLRAQLLESQARILAMDKSLQDSHPDMRELKAQLDALQSDSGTLAKRSVDVASRLRILQDQHGELGARQAEVMALKKELAELQPSMPDMGAFALQGGRLKSIAVVGLSAELRDQLMAKLSVHVGDKLTAESLEKLQATVKQFDEHLGLSIASHDGDIDVRIIAPGSEEHEERHI